MLQVDKLRNRDHLLSVGLLLLSVLACSQASCERDTRVAIHESKNPPTFSLSGNGHLNFFWVSEVDPPQTIPKDAQTMNARDRILWQIWPRKIQCTAIPAQGAPAPLVEGKIYEAGGPSSGANMNVFRFTIQDGRAVEMQ
jgi:hypothetical protein